MQDNLTEYLAPGGAGVVGYGGVNLTANSAKVREAWFEMMVRFEALWTDIIEMDEEFYKSCLPSLTEVRDASPSNPQSAQRPMDKLNQYLQEALKKARGEAKQNWSIVYERWAEVYDYLTYIMTELVPNTPKPKGIPTKDKDTFDRQQQESTDPDPKPPTPPKPKGTKKTTESSYDELLGSMLVEGHKIDGGVHNMSASELKHGDIVFHHEHGHLQVRDVERKGDKVHVTDFNGKVHAIPHDYQCDVYPSPLHTESLGQSVGAVATQLNRAAPSNIQTAIRTAQAGAQADISKELRTKSVAGPADPKKIPGPDALSVIKKSPLRPIVKSESAHSLKDLEEMDDKAVADYLGALTAKTYEEQETNEATITPALLRAYSKSADAHRPYRSCKHCDAVVPVYPGRYAKKCPGCGKDAEQVQNKSEDSKEEECAGSCSVGESAVDDYEPQDHKAWILSGQVHKFPSGVAHFSVPHSNKDAAKFFGHTPEEVKAHKHPDIYSSSAMSFEKKVGDKMLSGDAVRVDVSDDRANFHSALTPDSLKHAQKYVATHAPHVTHIGWQDEGAPSTESNYHISKRDHFLSATHPDEIKHAKLSLVGAFHEASLQEGNPADWSKYHRYWVHVPTGNVHKVDAVNDIHHEGHAGKDPSFAKAIGITPEEAKAGDQYWNGSGRTLKSNPQHLHNYDSKVQGAINSGTAVRVGVNPKGRYAFAQGIQNDKGLHHVQKLLSKHSHEVDSITVEDPNVDHIRADAVVRVPAKTFHAASSWDELRHAGANAAHSMVSQFHESYDKFLDSLVDGGSKL
jgi:hypothetical protein